MKNILWLAFNAKFTHTSLAARYLRQAAAEINIPSSVLELTINNHIPDILSEIYSYRPDIVGISCYIWNIELVKQIVPLLRKVLPHTIIICGGPEVSYGTEQFMKENSAVDFVIRGEAEETVQELLQMIILRQELDYQRWLTSKPDAKGLAYRRADGTIAEGEAVTVVDADNPRRLTVPFPYVQAEMEDIKDKILYYETSRGCPFSCAYCLSCATAGVRFRPWPEVKEELDFFVDHDVRQIKFVDRTFNAQKEHFYPILQYIRDLPASCRTNFHFEMAVDYLDGETISILQAMPKGRVQLEIGIQTTNKQVLERIARINHWDKICHNIKALQKNHNMHIHTDLIIGLPGEDMASFGRSFNDLYALHTDMLQIGFLKFLKGAAMMELVEKYDYQYMDIGPYEVLSNNVLDYGQIRWLHIFEQVFELYHNAGRCLKSADYLIKTFFAGDAFAFYARFTDYWEQQGNHRRSISARSLYNYLWAFFEQLAQSREDTAHDGDAYLIMDNLLRYDALTADGGQNRPEFLNWNGEKYQEQTAAFWRDKLRSGKGASGVIDGFKFTNWRELNRKYHIEFFEAAVSDEVIVCRRQVLLFIYNRGVFDKIVELDLADSLP